jgi:hypothetical protein
MSVDHIRYDLLVREALREVVRRVVSDVAKNGVPGDHHFYICFDTRAPGVRLSPRLRAQYPEEMTIVLQHQFWDLLATESGLEVGLSFGGVAERLAVPFDAIKGFFDPSVQFGLEFDSSSQMAADETEGKSLTRGVSLPPAVVPAKSPPAVVVERKRSGRGKAPVADSLAAEAGSSSEPIKQDGMADVVRLDRFRKK